MAGQVTGKYAQNANQAAVGVPQCATGGCSSCVKSGLPILLVRPGLAEKTYANSKHAAIEKLLPGVADPALSYSGYVMRTLRAGYVYAYYEQPHTAELRAQKGWQALQVDALGYLTPFPIEQLPVPGAAKEFSCQRTDGYAAAMLFVIPDAQNTARVWVGFSDTPWSDKVRVQYAGDEKLRNRRMACINAPKASCTRGIPMSEASLSSALPEYDADKRKASAALLGNPYPGVPLDKDGKPLPRKEAAKDVYNQASVIVTRGKQFDVSKAMLVSVPDAVGVTHEAAQLRLELPQEAKKILAAKDGYWKLQSAMSIKALVEIFDAQYKNLGNTPGLYGESYMPRAQFDDMKNRGALPPGATFIPQAYTVQGGGMFPGGTYTNPSLGTVSIPHDELPAVRLQKKAGTGYTKYLEQYDRACESDSKLLARIETDYGSWLTSPARRLVTEHDFDETARQDGVYYAHVVSKVAYGGPITDVGAGWYADFIKSDPRDKNNILVRAMLGNQKDFFDWFKESDQRSKTVDEAKALFDVIEELEKAEKGGKLVGMLAHSLPYLRILASAAGYGLMPLAGAAGVMLSKLKKTPPDLLKKMEVLIARISVTSVTTSKIRATRVQVSEEQAKIYWREIARASKGDIGKSTRKVGESEVTNVTRSGALAMDLSGPKGSARVDVYVFESVTATTTTLAELPKGGEQLKEVARRVGKVIKEGGAVLSAGGAVIQLLCLCENLEKLRNGNDEVRVEAYLGLASAALGSSAALAEVSAAFSKEWEKLAVATGLKVVAGFASALSSVLDGVTAITKVISRSHNSDSAAAAAYGAQAFFFFSAALAGGAAIASAAGVLTVTGFGLSWTGWGFLLVALGVAAGYIAMMIQNTPAEDWVAGTVWGSKAWGSLAKEQDEMNKLLLGISVDFSYRNGVGDSLLRSMAVVGMGGLPSPQMSDYAASREAWLSFSLNKKLREKLTWSIQIYGKRRDGHTVLLMQRGSRLPAFPGTAAATLDGVDKGRPDVKDDGNTVIVSADLNTMTFSGASAKVRVESPDGDVLVEEQLP
ncbi:T6SS effector BTH_I2691 family protein [Ralstonia insidiosa]|uniref:T6SS effector BTH_I2691 family protein n=1 Tax=Ralstonia insidiosa TaxID=190721 RepID=UPI001427D854|nr:T6SS effector BTH_I2691 family protein [Ralstonia insidiosa]